MRIRITLIIVLFSQLCFTQYYLTGEDPSSIKWKQIKTSNFKIIFPSGFEKNANTCANYIEYVNGIYRNDTINRKYKIPVILHNQTSYSNGTVVWAPKRMELFTLPSQNMFALNWMAQLSLHEVRHVSQIESLNTGFTKGLGLLFGEQAVGAVTGLVPRWYYEGDAVYAETKYSLAGRGRMPSFQNSIIAANLEMDKRLSYDQVIYGSYKYYTPSIYAYGYHMVDYGHKKYGDKLWENNLDYVGKRPFLLTPFYFSLKNQTGYSKEQFYNLTYNYLDSIWGKRNDLLESNQDEIIISPESKFYTNYRYPQFVDDSTIIALKEGIDQTSEFIQINLYGNENVILNPGVVWNTRFSLNDNKIVWAEQVFDTRWEHRTYTCIKLYDLRTKKIKTILKKGRYFAPAISPDGKKISVIEANSNGIFSILYYDIDLNSISKLLIFNDNEVAQTPSWLNNEELVYIILDDSGKRIEKYNIKSKIKTVLFDAGCMNISNPSATNGLISFNFDYGNVNDIYFLDTSRSVVYKKVDTKFGAYDADFNANNSLIVYNQYYSLGHRICYQKFNYEKLQAVNLNLNKETEQNNNDNIDFSIVNHREYEIEKYSKLSHLFKIHSWAPFYADIQQLSDNPFSAEVYPGALFSTQNSLGTAYGTAGYAYSANGSFIKSSFTYRGFYPVIKMQIKKGGRPYVIPGDSIPPYEIKTDYTSLDLQTYIPLNLSKDRWIRSITPAISYSFSNSHIYNYWEENWSRNISYLVYQLNLRQYQIKSYRDLLPRFGQFISIKYYSSVSNSKNLFPDIFNIKSSFYFPGLFKNHHIQLDIDYEAQQKSAYQLNGYLKFPRGFNHSSANVLLISRFNYLFPVLYP
ncbi:hypothetical protein ACFLTE_11540, partial [Bacteroidota bacterium]